MAFGSYTQIAKKVTQSCTDSHSTVVEILAKATTHLTQLHKLLQQLTTTKQNPTPEATTVPQLEQSQPPIACPQ